RHGGARSAECALQLLEEAFVGLVRVVADAALELLEQTALLLRHAVRDEHVDEHAVVAAPVALQHRHPVSVEDVYLARLRAGLERQLLFALERRHGDGRAERGLRHRQLNRREDIVAVAHEARVRAHVDEHIRIARAAAEGARVPLARDADALAVVDPGRDRDLELALLEDPPCALADLAELLDLLAGAGAGRAGVRADELAEDAARDLADPPDTAAGRARRDRASGLGARAAAVLAGHRDCERDLTPGSARRLDELELDLGCDVGPPGVATRSSAE